VDSKGIIDEVLDNKDERLGTIRTELKEALDANDDPMAKAFDEQTPFQEFVGKIVSGLCSAHGKADIENVWIWAEQQLKLDGSENPSMDWNIKCLTLFQAAFTLGVASPSCYRGQRKMLLTATADFNKAVEYPPPSPDYSDEVKAKYAIQCETQKLLAKARSNEEVEAAWKWAEVQIGMGIMPGAKVQAMFCVFADCQFNESKYESIKNIFVKMLNN